MRIVLAESTEDAMPNVRCDERTAATLLEVSAQTRRVPDSTVAWYVQYRAVPGGVGGGGKKVRNLGTWGFDG